MKDFPEKIDLHMHTVISDGTDRPEEILEKVKAEGIGFFSNIIVKLGNGLI